VIDGRDRHPPDRAFHVVLRFIEENPSPKGNDPLSVE